MNPPVSSVVATLAAGALGGVLFAVLHLPLPWMLGAIFGVVVASRFSLPMVRPPRMLLDPARVVLGLAIGSQFSPDMLGHLGQYAVSLVFLIPYVALSGLLGWWWFHKVGGLDRPTAFLSAMPGGLAELIFVGEEIGADIRKVALIQGTRVLLLVYTLPFAAGTLAHKSVGGGATGMPGLFDHDILSVASLAALGGAGWWVFKKLGLSGAPIIGAMMFAAAASMLGVLPQEPPDTVFRAAQWILGSSVGGVFIGHPMRQMAGVVRQSVGFLLLLVVMTPAWAWMVTQLTHFSFVSALLAFAPGGQAEMSLISIILGENTGYVALHHLFRLVLVLSLIPILARHLFGKR